jgi:hypothetical protein
MVWRREIQLSVVVCALLTMPSNGLGLEDTTGHEGATSEVA